MKEKTIGMLQKNMEEIISSWTTYQLESVYRYSNDIDEASLQKESSLLMSRLIESFRSGSFNAESEEFRPLKDLVIRIAKRNTSKGYSAKEVGMFILSLKITVMDFLYNFYEQDPKLLIEEIREFSGVVDELASIVFDTFIGDREEVIERQRTELFETSTPVIKLWEGILAVPIIGTVDSQRSQLIMEKLLTAISNTGFEIAIIDISGVSALDTLTAQHILKTADAARLMGATCIISGISPNIAQTIISLNIDLGMTKTMSTMSDAIKMALVIIKGKQQQNNSIGYGTDNHSGNWENIDSSLAGGDL